MESNTHKRTHSETSPPQYRLPDLAGLSLNEPQKQNHEDKLQDAGQYSPTGVIPDEEMPDVEDDIMVVSRPLLSIDVITDCTSFYPHPLSTRHMCWNKIFPSLTP